MIFGKIMFLYYFGYMLNYQYIMKMVKRSILVFLHMSIFGVFEIYYVFVYRGKYVYIVKWYPDNW